MTRIPLLVAVYDRDGRIGALLPSDFPSLLAHFASVTVVCRTDTLPRTVETLRDYGAEVVVDNTLTINPRPYMLRFAHARAAWTHVHMGDFDSALHWARDYPNELDAANAAIAAHDFTLLGRTARAIATLPDVQRATEHLINAMFAATTGGFDAWRVPFVHPPDGALMDICAGAWGFSRRGLDALIARAQTTDIGFHAEWPLLARDTVGLRCAYLPCDGMEYETADRYTDEIAAAGGPKAWHAAQNRDAARWRFRLAYVNQVADFLARHQSDATRG